MLITAERDGYIGLLCCDACVKKRLQQNLSGQFVHPLFAFLFGQFRRQQKFLRLKRREAFILKCIRQSGDGAQPLRKLASFAGLFAFIAAQMNRQADHQTHWTVFFDNFAKEPLIDLDAMTIMVVSGLENL